MLKELRCFSEEMLVDAGVAEEQLVNKAIQTHHERARRGENFKLGSPTPPRVNERMHSLSRINERTNERRNEKMNECMNERANERMQERMNE